MEFLFINRGSFVLNTKGLVVRQASDRSLEEDGNAGRMELKVKPRSFEDPLFESLPFPIGILDSEGTLLNANEAWREEFSVEPVWLKTLLPTRHPWDEQPSLQRSVSAPGSARKQVTLHITRLAGGDGEGDGEGVGNWRFSVSGPGFTTDSFAETARGLAHEINNPLSIILGRAEQIERQAHVGELSAPGVLDFAAKIKLQTLRIASLVRAFRTLARDADHDEVVAASPRAIFDAVTAISLPRVRTVGVKWLAELPERDPPWVCCRSDQVSQILVEAIAQLIDLTVDSGLDGLIRARLTDHFIEVTSSSTWGAASHVRGKSRFERWKLVLGQQGLELLRLPNGFSLGLSGPGKTLE